MARLTSEDQMSLSDLRQMWGALEDITAVLIEMSLWLPPGDRRRRIQHAIGELVPLAWDVAREANSVQPGAQRARQPG